MSENEFSILNMTGKVITGFIVYSALFFVPAGRFDWIEAWIFLLLSFFYVLLIIVYFSKRDPTNLISRSKLKPEKSFDLVFVLLAGVSFFLMLLLSAMEFRLVVVQTCL